MLGCFWPPHEEQPSMGSWYWSWMITFQLGGLMALATLGLWTWLPGDVRNLAMALVWVLWALATVSFDDRLAGAAW